MARNQIVVGGHIGPERALDPKGLKHGKIFLSMSLANDELQVDEMQLEHDLAVSLGTVIRPQESSGILTADGKILAAQPVTKYFLADPNAYGYGEVVRYDRRGELFARQYLKKRMSLVHDTIYSIPCMSAIGILEGSLHYGGMYNGDAAEVVIERIIGGLVPYTLDPAFAKEPLYGHLPIATRRSNLHQVLFALGACVFKDTDGNMYIGAIDPNAEYKTIPPDRVYTSGGSTSPIAEVSKVTVMEHTYAAVDDVEEEVLFEGTVPEDTFISPVRDTSVMNGPWQYETWTGAMVTFDKPMMALYLRDGNGNMMGGPGSTMLTAVNYCLLPPCGYCKLTGKPYTHTTRQVVRPAAGSRSISAAGKEVTVSNATLISLVNVENVASRVYSYYKDGEIVKANMDIETERPGDKIAFTDPKGRAIQGIIKSMDINISGTLKGTVEVVTGYEPTGIGNFYNNVQTITQSGTFTVPLDIKTSANGKAKVRIVLVSGGSGGASGAPGKRGESRYSPNTRTSGAGGDGGAPGAPGTAGKVAVYTLEVEPGQVLRFTIGKGGKGGVCDGTQSVAGTAGTATTCEGYSSEDGASPINGYVDIIGGVTYARRGLDGLYGSKGNGPGGDGPQIVVASENNALVTYKPGANGKAKSHSTGSADGGYGGGAAVGHDGSDGTNATAGSQGAHGGNGGDGANAVPAKAGEIPGSGGQGGHGGGGGGGGGYGYSSVPMGGHGGDGGEGGLGGDGGDGADGIGLIYF